MNPQGNNYLSNNMTINMDRYKSNTINSQKRLGDRTLFSNSIDGNRYYSSLDAEIYLGDTFIDNVVQITWSVQQATLPLYGYNSYTFDDIAVGARQISGTFQINFTKALFMFDVLKAAQGVYRTSLNIADDPTDDSKLSWSSFFDKEHKPMWDRSFNIKVGYGDYTKGGANTSVLILHCVQLTGCQQLLDIGGDPIGEAYSFIAKDIRYNASGIPENDEKTTDDNTDEQDIDSTNGNILISASYHMQSRYNQYENKMEHESISSLVITCNASSDYNITDIKIQMQGPKSTIINNAYRSVGNNIKTTINCELYDDESKKMLKDIEDAEKEKNNGDKIDPYNGYCTFVVYYTHNYENSTYIAKNVKCPII